MAEKLVVTLRVKDAIIFIHDWLKCYELLADEIVVVDNGSTDGTYEILKAHHKVTAIERTEGFDEGRDFEVLLSLLKQRRPDWVLTVDADEIFEKRVTRAHLERMMRRRWISRYRFRRFHLFGDEGHYFAKWHNLMALAEFGDRSLYRFSDHLYVPKKKIHTSILGQSKFFLQSSLRLRHLCFLHKEYRRRAYETYLKVDGGSANQHKYERDLLYMEAPELMPVWTFKKTWIGMEAEYIFFNFLSIALKPVRISLRVLKRVIRR